MFKFHSDELQVDGYRESEKNNKELEPGNLVMTAFAWISTCQPKHQAEIHYKQCLFV
jgi:hypothetical protein